MAKKRQHSSPRPPIPGTARVSGIRPCSLVTPEYVAGDELGNLAETIWRTDFTPRLLCRPVPADATFDEDSSRWSNLTASSWCRPTASGGCERPSWPG